MAGGPPGPFGSTIPSNHLGGFIDTPATPLPFRQNVQVPTEPLARRQGEPDWDQRPVAQASGDIFAFPRYNEKSWEELELEKRMKEAPPPELDDAAKNKLDNSLSILRDSKEMVDVIVGKESALWHLHEKLLCAASPFFNAAVNSLFREGVEKRITMEEDDSDVFTLYVQWLYAGQFTARSMWILLKAYALGDKLGTGAFRAQAIDKLYALNTFECNFTVEQVLWVFENTMTESALRKLTVDTIGFGICSKTFELSTENWEALSPVLPDIMQGVVAVVGYQKDQRWTPKPRFSYWE